MKTNKKISEMDIQEAIKQLAKCRSDRMDRVIQVFGPPPYERELWWMEMVVLSGAYDTGKVWPECPKLGEELDQ